LETLVTQDGTVDIKNCEAVKQCFKSILIVLKNEIENEADRDVNEAIGII